jgi:NADH-quinone oxidoreductase subunit N
MAVNYSIFLPEAVIAVTAIAVLLADLFVWKEDRIKLSIISIAGMLASLVFVYNLKDIVGSTLSMNVQTDQFALFFKVLFVLVAVSIVLISQSYFGNKFVPGEYLALLLFSVVGMMIMVSTTDLLVLFLGVEITSISSYILSGYSKTDEKSNEASIKYLVLGIIASAIMLYGISFLYGLTGQTQLASMATSLATSRNSLVIFGLILVLAAFAFKFAAAPFHQWVPDVYEGAPTPVTAFLSVGTKMAAVAALIRVLLVGFPDLIIYWRAFFIILAIVSMLVGNLAAISQKNIKRMLAYSSIAHVGYILIGIVVASKLALTGVLFYMVAYALMNIGAFAVVIAVSDGKNLEYLENYKGLSKRSPFLALSMAVFMISLTGLPPTSGLWGKVYIFGAAINNNLAWLAIIGLINSVVSMYYYANVIRHMYLLEPEVETALTENLPIKAVILVMVIGVILLGVLPQQLTEISKFSSLFGV